MAPTGNCPTSNVEQQETSVGGSSSANPPLRQVLHITGLEPKYRNDKSDFIADDTTITEQEAGKSLKEEAWYEEEQGEGQGTNQGGSNEPPSREVLNRNPASDEAKESDQPHSPVLEYVIKIPETIQPAESAQACQTEMSELIEQDDHSGGSEKPPSRGVPTCLIDPNETTSANTPCLVLPVADATETPPEDAIYTCQMEPFLPACVTKILELVQIGEDITNAQCQEVEHLIAEYADCFVLLLSEVNVVPGAVHKLNTPENSMFRTKYHSAPLTPIKDPLWQRRSRRC